MNRRDMMLGAGALTLAAASRAAFADAENHVHRHHHGQAPNQGLIDATSECVQKGQACLNHCFELLGQGDKEMAACAKSVNQMLAVCTALQQLASAQSPHLSKMARVAADVCKDCEEECRKHAKKHTECRDCAEACAACLKACKAVA